MFRLNCSRVLNIGICFSQRLELLKIDSIYAAKAIAQFIRTMISGNSKFDVIYKVENNYTLSSDEASLYASVTASGTSWIWVIQRF